MSSANRLTKKLDSRNAQLSFTYDKVDNLLTKTTYQNTTTNYLYNAANRLVSLSNLDYIQADYQLDPAGRVLSRVSNSGARTLTQYDANGWVSRLMQYDAANALVSDTTYTRDRMGNILTQTNAVGANTGTATFTYDALYRLTSADYPNTANDEAYTYDKVGNRKTVTKGSLTTNANTRYYNYTPNTNRLAEIRIGSATGTLESSFSYDFEGRLISQTGTGAKTLTWDAKNRLKTLTKSGTTDTYGYDPMDYRIRHSNTANGQLDYYLEGEHLESVEQNGQLTEKYFRGASTDELIAAYLKDTDGKTKPFQFHHDNLTSTTQVTGHNGGTLQSTTYSAFGATQSQTGSSPNRLKYTGREDDGTGLYYYRARYYDADGGRFISEDPMGFQAGINFYAYVGNNPINGNDPSGMELVMVTLPSTGGKMGNFFFDQEIAPSMVGFVTQLRNSNIPVTVNLAFRTTEEQAALYANRANNPNPVAMPGTSRHEGGFAIDLNGISKLSADNRSLANEIASSYGLSPIAKDPPHFQADAVTYGYSSRADAIKTNQRDYSLGLPFQNGSFNFSIPQYTQPTTCCSINPTSGPSVFSPDLSFSFNTSFGGFLLYPNKPNNNQIRNVYSK